MDDAEKFHLFVAQADELCNRRLLKKEPNLGFHISWSEKIKEINFKPKEQIDEEDLRSLLMGLRKFISNDEPINIYRILNLCEKRCTSENTKQEFRKARIAWKQRSGIGIGIVMIETNAVTGLELSRHVLEPEFMLDLWINGHYFHNDEEKRKLLIKLTSTNQITSFFGRQDFISYVFCSSWYICILGDLINRAILAGSMDLA